MRGEAGLDAPPERILRLVSGQLQGTHPDGGNQTSQQNTGEPNNHGDQACEEPLWHQIAIADGKPVTNVK